MTYIGTGGGPLGLEAGFPHGFTVTANNLFIYGIVDPGYGSPELTAFKRQSAGDLQPYSFSETDAPPYDSSHGWLKVAVATDPTNRLATVAMQEQGIPMGSYTLLSWPATPRVRRAMSQPPNTWQTIAKPVIWPTGLNMSPSGKLLAAGNVSAVSEAGEEPGRHLSGPLLSHLS